MRERCGVVAVRTYGDCDIRWTLVDALRSLQHRGQESWGVWTSGGYAFRRPGLVSQSLQEYLTTCNDRPFSGIGHVRYSTVGGMDYVQPISIGDRFHIAHNGTIANYVSLARELGLGGRDAGSDTLVAGHLLSKLVERFAGDWVEALNEFSRRVVGSFCLVIALPDGTLMAARDPYGFRPLCIGLDDRTETWIAASESCAVNSVGGRLLRDVRPGELVVLSRDGVEAHRFSEPKGRRVCSFEYVYFAHPDSVIDGISVYEVRKRLGRLMAERCPVEGDVVVPVPESARPAALGFSEASGLPLEDALVKDRYMQKGRMRGFIEPEAATREGVARWIMPVGKALEGKRVILIDDSIVRGVTARIVVNSIRRAGAKSVVLVSTFPPILHPCMMGMDFPDAGELVAYRALMRSGVREVNERFLREVSKEVGADLVVFSDVETVARAIGLDESELCFSCTTGDYGELSDLPIGVSRWEFKGV